VHPMCP